jgi:hypothetical protein
VEESGDKKKHSLHFETKKAKNMVMLIGSATYGLHMRELIGPKWPLMLPISFSKILWKKTLWNLPDLPAVVVTLSADCPPPMTT